MNYQKKITNTSICTKLIDISGEDFQEESEEETSSNEDTTIRSDAYLLESMAILEDYIRLQQRVEVKN